MFVMVMLILLDLESTQNNSANAPPLLSANDTNSLTSDDAAKVLLVKEYRSFVSFKPTLSDSAVYLDFQDRRTLVGGIYNRAQ